MFWGWIWIGVLVLAVIIEAVTDQLVSIWFVPGAIVATVLDFFSVDIIWQIIVLLGVSALGILVARRFLVNLRRDDNTKTDLDMIVGEKCIVTERIDSFAGCGQAKVKGQIWSARGLSESDVFEVGEILRVVSIEGVKLICKRI
ncbi:MAG: NfeD family protein [Clostridia bacterium]|nr:NfeD family protein [Clostridia bacterium]